MWRTVFCACVDMLGYVKVLRYMYDDCGMAFVEEGREREREGERERERER